MVSPLSRFCLSAVTLRGPKALGAGEHHILSHSLESGPRLGPLHLNSDYSYCTEKRPPGGAPSDRESSVWLMTQKNTPEPLWRQAQEMDRDGNSHEGSDDNDSDTIPHSWLGHRNLLRLLDPSFSGNHEAFLKEWKKDHPVIISHITEKLDLKLWTPTYFSQGYGESKVDIVNCITGEVIPDQRMKLFWDGFEDLGSRLKDKRGHPMILKMKEWPRCTMFESVLPEHMNDLLGALPLSACTHPKGLFNFINYLPKGILSDDLGTELLCGYGAVKYPWVGTKKVDVNKSDSLSILVYVGKVTNEDGGNEGKKVLQAVKDAGCDQLSMERVKMNGDI
ncbi:Uncharacterized protein GBIM_06516, partial [Gryllus bimaculatus]